MSYGFLTFDQDDDVPLDEVLDRCRQARKDVATARSQTVSDQELLAFLAAQGYDPKTQPYFCAEVVQERYDVPLWIAQQWVDNLR